MLKKDYKLVVIGGSLGGMDGVITILSRLPEDFKIPIVIALHRMKNVKSSLEELIQKKVKLKVNGAEDKMKIASGNVYIAPANYHLLIEKDGTLSLDNAGSVNYSKPSIDLLFESAAWCCKHHVVGILLTGANADGSAGLHAIKEAGGITIVQDPLESVAPTMPLNAIRRFDVGNICTLDQIAELLIKMNQ
ncbi:MAG: chemotaxis protein CheB [Cytophagaceae bacterium]